MSDRDRESTYIENFISVNQKEPLSLKNFTETILVGDTDSDHIYRTTIDDFFLQHWHELSSTVELFGLPQEFFYQPKALSLQLYGTTDLWLALLRVNGMKNITEFHYPFIRIYNPARLKKLIDVFFKRDGKKT